MARLPAITAREMVKLLKQAGFLETHQQGSHLYLWHPVTKRMTCVPLHTGDLPKGTARAILRQAGLSPDDLERLY